MTGGKFKEQLLQKEKCAPARLHTDACTPTACPTLVASHLCASPTAPSRRVVRRLLEEAKAAKTALEEKVAEGADASAVRDEVTKLTEANGALTVRVAELAAEAEEAGKRTASLDAELKEDKEKNQK